MVNISGNALWVMSAVVLVGLIYVVAHGSQYANTQLGVTCFNTNGAIIHTYKATPRTLRLNSNFTNCIVEEIN